METEPTPTGILDDDSCMRSALALKLVPWNFSYLEAPQPLLLDPQRRCNLRAQRRAGKMCMVGRVKCFDLNAARGHSALRGFGACAAVSLVAAELVSTNVLKGLHRGEAVAALSKFSRGGFSTLVKATPPRPRPPAPSLMPYPSGSMPDVCARNSTSAWCPMHDSAWTLLPSSPVCCMRSELGSRPSRKAGMLALPPAFTARLEGMGSSSSSGVAGRRP
eukprot:364247-Chlamydomonas_euryale.AAC.21